MTNHTPIQLGITGWGIVSPIGIGVDAFQQACSAGKSGQKVIKGYAAGSLPFEEACTIPEFETAAFLGRKGTWALDRTTALAVTATGMALIHSGLAVDTNNQTRIGVVLGTSTGSIKSIGDFTRETLTQERPYLVNPMLFPNTVMNCAAGQSAIWHKLQGVNATISGGRMSGLSALRYADLMIRLNYADTIVFGAVEEFCEQTAWGFYHAGAAQPHNGASLGEGCAMFQLEQHARAKAEGRKILAEVLACEAGFYGHTRGGTSKKEIEGLHSCIQQAMEKADISSADVSVVSSSSGKGDQYYDRIETEAIRLAVKDSGRIKNIRIAQSVGECFSASFAFQIAALLAFFGNTAGRQKRIGLVTSIGHSGSVGCAVMREG